MSLAKIPPSCLSCIKPSSLVNAFYDISHARLHRSCNMRRSNEWRGHVLEIGSSQNYKHALCFSRAPSESSEDLEEQKKIVNLGLMADRLKALVPDLLQRSLPKDLLSQHVLLQVCPAYFKRINSYLPSIKGHASYYATCKAAQIFFTSFLLNPQAKLHIESIRTSNFSYSSCLYPRSSKIFIRWSTCPEGCHHLLDADRMSHTGDKFSESANFSTASAKLGLHQWSDVNAARMFNHSNYNWTLPTSILEYGKELTGLRKEDVKLERIISGLFIFELNEENNEVLVHTIESFSIIENKTQEGVANKLHIC